MLCRLLWKSDAPPAPRPFSQAAHLALRCCFRSSRFAFAQHRRSAQKAASPLGCMRLRAHIKEMQCIKCASHRATALENAIRMFSAMVATSWRFESNKLLFFFNSNMSPLSSPWDTAVQPLLLATVPSVHQRPYTTFSTPCATTPSCYTAS